MAHRLFILGLDGADYDLVSRLCEEGVTPNLRDLARGGALGPLRSTTPPITGPSWLGLASGLAPDQTGVPDFLVREGEVGMRPISSRDFRGRALWEPVGGAGGRVAVFNFPILYPPYPVNGVMVSGFGTDESTQWTYPTDLKADLLAAVGRDYNLTVNYHHDVYDDAHLFLDDLERSLDRRLAAADLVCRREPWDLFCFILSETDWLLHRCWADLDEGHPAHDPRRSPAVAERVRHFWGRVDAAVPRLLEAFGPGGSLLVCSDHGFGPNSRTVKVNSLLEREGLLIRRALSRRRGAAVRRAGAEAARRAGSAAARVGGPLGRALGRARRKARRFLPRDDSAYLAGVIDFDRSEIFDPGHTIPFAGLYVAPRHERGGPEYLRALERAEEALAGYAVRSGLAVEVRRAWADAPSRPPTLPDLLVSADDWGCTFSKADFTGEVLVEGPFSPRHTGSHRMRGLYLASGPAFRAPGGGAPAAEILDVAPTVLALFGLAPPPDRRGRVLAEILAAPPQATTPTADAAPPADEARPEDEADVRERLRGLGYIE
jgi:predicted AlkP superfamily phosphohydrolase/phosphomutase